MNPLPLVALLALAPAQVGDPAPNPRVTPEVLVVRAAAPAVVYIEVSRPVPVGVDRATGTTLAREQVVSGSGVVIDKSGWIVTNNHVVASGLDSRLPQQIRVQFDPERDPATYVAELVSQVPSEDLALLKIKGDKDFPVVTMGTSSDLMIGEKVVVIGNPFRQRLTASTGIISGLHRNMAVGDLMFPDLIQTDASINPGNSGGPMLNILGEMIGMTTLVRQEAENMAFAIPIDRIKDVLSEELLAPTAARAYLGVEIEPGGPAVVSRIAAQGPGDLAGLRAEDRIEALNGEAIADASDFNLKHLPLRWVKPIQLRVARGEEHLELSVLPWNKIDGILYERLGMTVESVALGRYPFLIVRRVAPDGPAQKLGLKRDDIIEALRAEGGQAWVVSSDRGLARLISTMKPGTELALDVLRDDNGDQQLDHTKELYKGAVTLR